MHYSTAKHTRKEHFTVVRPFDLNEVKSKCVYCRRRTILQIPSARRAVNIHGLVEAPPGATGGCRSHEASIEASVALEKRAYVPGERVDVVVLLRNEWLHSLKNVRHNINSIL